MIKSIYSIQKLKALARRIDRLNSHTPCHSENVAGLALELCKALGLRGKKKNIVITACLIHDVGKSVIDSKIWSKKKRLTRAEWLKIKIHPVITARLAKEAGCNKKVAELLYYHHVWYNGNGYPDADKKGTRIPLGARILAICDAYEAMISRRSYRETGLSSEEAIEELRKEAVKQFDPRLVEVFAEMLNIEK